MKIKLAMLWIILFFLISCGDKVSEEELLSYNKMRYFQMNAKGPSLAHIQAERISGVYSMTLDIDWTVFIPYIDYEREPLQVSVSHNDDKQKPHLIVQIVGTKGEHKGKMLCYYYGAFGLNLISTKLKRILSESALNEYFPSTPYKGDLGTLSLQRIGGGGSKDGIYIFIDEAHLARHNPSEPIPSKERVEYIWFTFGPFGKRAQDVKRVSDTNPNFQEIDQACKKAE